MDTVMLVQSLIENYQVNNAKIQLGNSQQSESDEVLQSKISTLKKQMQLLELSMKCLTDKERKLLTMIYIDNVSLADVGKAYMTCKSNIYRRRNNAIKKLAKVYEDLAK